MQSLGWGNQSLFKWAWSHDQDADDSSLFYAAANIADIAGIINHDLQLLSNWAKQWLVTFNPLKNRSCLIYS